jgi:ubiquinone/menaquinone biosynthesis C-methylase UbiE
MDMLKVYRCPYCNSGLDFKEISLICQSCHTEFTISDDGIPLFFRKKDYYWNPIEKEKMGAVLDLKNNGGWKSFLDKLFDEFRTDDIKEEWANMIFRESRTGWKFLVDLSSRENALDIGCGMGITAFNLCRNFENVFAMDMTLERLQFTQSMSKEMQLSNLNVVGGGDTTYLPFPDKYFDLVSLVGVLEWVPSNYQNDRNSSKNKFYKAWDVLVEPWFKSNPRKMQVDLLREINRVLKPTGTLYLAIENRFDYHYFYKTPDTHTDLMYASLMPRFLANMYSLIFRRTSYREYTHSYSALKRMMVKSGFKSTDCYSLYPDYRIYDEIYCLTNEQAVPANTPFSGIRDKLNRSRLFCPSFGLTARKHKKDRNFIEAVRDYIETERGAKYILGRYHVMPKGNVVLELTEREDISRGIIVKIPIDATADTQSVTEFRILEELHKNKNIQNKLGYQIPKALLRSTIDGQNFFIQEKINGVPVRFIAADQASKLRVINDCIEFIIDFHSCTSETVLITETEYIRIAGALLERVKRVANGYEKVFDKIDAILRSIFIGKAFTLVQKHGDFSFANLLTDSKNFNLNGVIDWDNSDYRQPALIDVINLLESFYNFAGYEMGNVVTEVFLKGNLTPNEKSCIAKYLSAFPQYEELSRPLSIVYWLAHIDSQLKYKFLTYNPKWMEQNYFNVIEELNRML